MFLDRGELGRAGVVAEDDVGRLGGRLEGDAAVDVVSEGVTEGGATYPPWRFARSMASSRAKEASSPVKTKERPSRQSGDFGSGTVLEPGARGPAALAAFAATQLNLDMVVVKVALVFIGSLN